MTSNGVVNAWQQYVDAWYQLDYLQQLLRIDISNFKMFEGHKVLSS